MARLARVVIAGLPHHVSQRGNARARAFFGDADYTLYCRLLAEHCRSAEVNIWAWVLMPDHVHLILTPRDSDGIRRALSISPSYLCPKHQCPAQTRRPFFSRPPCALSSSIRCAYGSPCWHARLGRVQDDQVTDTAPLRSRIPDFTAFITTGEDQDLSMALQRAKTIGRPPGDDAFLAKLEKRTDRALKPDKPEPKSQE